MASERRQVGARPLLLASGGAASRPRASMVVELGFSCVVELGFDFSLVFFL
jgi:hypothetical protein